MVQNHRLQIGKKKDKPDKIEQKKGKFDWIKKLNIFKNSESKKEESKNK